MAFSRRSSYTHGLPRRVSRLLQLARTTWASTCDLSFWPGWKVTTRRAVMGISSPVLGLRPARRAGKSDNTMSLAWKRTEQIPKGAKTAVFAPRPPEGQTLPAILQLAQRTIVLLSQPFQHIEWADDFRLGPVDHHHQVVGGVADVGVHGALQHFGVKPV